MKKKVLISFFASLFSVCALAQAESYDVVVYGGNSSGVIAAYTAGRQGLKVAMLERTSHVGGLTTSGIGNVDIGWSQTVGGYTADFLRRVGAHYGAPHRMQISLECSVAEKIYLEMLEEAGVEVFFGTRMAQSGVTDRRGAPQAGRLAGAQYIMTGAVTKYENSNTGGAAGAILGGHRGGLLGGLVMYKTSGGAINPLIGSAGVSAVPMAARVSQDVGRKYNKNNYLLMHAMGPNVAGVIGSAIAAGFLLSVFG